MKIKLLVLLTGTFLAVAYLVGCGGGGNNNNSSCPAGQTYINGSCQIGVGVNGYANCQQYYGTATYQSCIAQSGCGGYGGGVATPYGGGYGGQYGGGYGGQYGYGGVNGVAGYPGQNCGGGGYPGGGGVYPPYPPQGGGYIYQPYPPMPPPYYGPYAPPGISWGVGVNLH